MLAKQVNDAYSNLGSFQVQIQQAALALTLNRLGKVYAG